jgi:hypothetical protein
LEIIKEKEEKALAFSGEGLYNNRVKQKFQSEVI